MAVFVYQKKLSQTSAEVKLKRTILGESIVQTPGNLTWEVPTSALWLDLNLQYNFIWHV
jgi:hypothetical protein